jgi:CRP/FNR family transcriptional regulator, cyclic AMP receptor protein
MLKTLAGVPLFEGLSEEDLKRLEKIAKRRSVGPNTSLFFEGDRTDGLYVVVSGSVKIYRTTDDGREKILNTMGAGEIFGELAMLDGQPRSASVETIEATELIAIARNDFHDLAMEAPEILWKVLQGLSERLRVLNDVQLDVAFRDSPYRIARAIARLAEKHGEKIPGGLKVRESFGVKALADMAATTPDRVGRALERLEDKGLVQVGEGELVVPDLAALKRAIEYMGSE